MEMVMPFPSKEALNHARGVIGTPYVIWPFFRTNTVVLVLLSYFFSAYEYIRELC